MPTTETKTKTPRKLTDLLSADFMARLDGLDVLSRKILQGKLHGERRSKRRGQSVEFADHRQYVSGDDLRFIDWNIYGRLDQLFMKLFLEELDLSVHLLIDVSGSAADGEPSKELFIKRLAAALGYVSLVNNNRVTVSLFGEGIKKQQSNLRGRKYLPLLAEMLIQTACEGPSDFDRACREVCANQVGSGIAIIVSDFLFKEGYADGLRRLTARKYDVYAVQVLSPQELNPPLSGDYRLVDIEDDDTAEVTINSALLEYYRRTVSQYCNELSDFCTRRGASYVLARSSDAVETLVLNTLRRIRLLR